MCDSVCNLPLNSSCTSGSQEAGCRAPLGYALGE